MHIESQQPLDKLFFFIRVGPHFNIYTIDYNAVVVLINYWLGA